MALQTIPGGVWTPDFSWGPGIPQFASTTAMTAATHKVAMIFHVPKAGNIRKIGFITGTVTAGGSSTLTATLETVDATTGAPSGSAYKGAALGTSATGLASDTWYTLTLGTDATSAVKGDVAAVVITYGTFTAADSIPIKYLRGSSSGVQPRFPYLNYYNGASWAFVTAQSFLALALEYDDGTYAVVQGALPISAITSQVYNSGTGTTDEYALSFQVPFPCRIRGCAVRLDNDGDTDIVLYSGTTALTTASLDKDVRMATSMSNMYVEFPSSQTLSANTVYRIGVKPTTTTNITLAIVTVPSAAAMDAFDGGQNFRLGTRLDAGAWDSDTTDKRPLISLFLDQFDDGATAGGMLIHPGMNGGLRG